MHSILFESSLKNIFAQRIKYFSMENLFINFCFCFLRRHMIIITKSYSYTSSRSHPRANARKIAEYLMPKSTKPSALACMKNSNKVLFLFSSCIVCCVQHDHLNELNTQLQFNAILSTDALNTTRMYEIKHA